MWRRLYSCDPLLGRWPPARPDVAAARRPCLQAAHPVGRERDLARPRHGAPADPPGVRDEVVGGAARAGRHQRRAVAGEAGDAVDPRGLHGLGEGHRRQNGGEPPGQHGRTRPGSRAGRLPPRPRRHDRDAACGCGPGSGACLIGASRRGSDAIGPQIESRCSGPTARLRALRQPPCSVHIDLKADPNRLTATARLLLCTRSGRCPRRPCNRPQHHSRAGVGQEQPPGGHGPAAPHNASAGDDCVTAIEGHPRRFAPPAYRRSEGMHPRRGTEGLSREPGAPSNGELIGLCRGHTQEGIGLLVKIAHLLFERQQDRSRRLWRRILGSHATERVEPSPDDRSSTSSTPRKAGIPEPCIGGRSTRRAYALESGQ
jgi:hypothetical protein